MPDAAVENGYLSNGHRVVVGIDEAGRGPLAGPVVAAAIWLDETNLVHEICQSIDDSKRLSAEVRERLFAILVDLAPTGVGVATVTEIDGTSIARASYLAMQRAFAQLSERLPAAAEVALIDGNQVPVLPCTATPLVGGDGTCLSIAAASIIAKVQRDRMMVELSERYPGYGWERNKGYGTAEHKSAIDRLGVTPEHRRSFRPVREASLIRR